MQSSILVPSLLLASCCDLWVLEEQLAIKVSASFRIRSDLVRLEWALTKYKVRIFFFKLEKMNLILMFEML